MRQPRCFSRPAQRAPASVPPVLRTTTSHGFARPLTLSLLAILFSTGSSAGADGIVILPGKIKLSNSRARQRLVIERTTGDNFLGDVSAGVELISHDPRIVVIEDQMVVPRANGTTRIEARWQGQGGSRGSH